MQNSVVFSFLIFQTIADLTPQANTLSVFPKGSVEDLPAGLSDTYLTASDGRGIESSWENNDVGLPTAANGPLIDNTESNIVVDQHSDCVQSNDLPAPGRLRRRDQKKIFCTAPQEYLEPTTTSPTKKEGTFLPSPNDEKPRLWPDLRQNTEMTKLWVQLNTLPGIDGEKNEEVCKRARESVPGVARHVPVCFPHPYTLDSPSDVVQPCRRWQDAPSCDIEWEELWCCVWARKRAAELLDISPSNFEYALRYNAVGLDCEKIVR